MREGEGGERESAVMMCEMICMCAWTEVGAVHRIVMVPLPLSLPTEVSFLLSCSDN